MTRISDIPGFYTNHLHPIEREREGSSSYLDHMSSNAPELQHIRKLLGERIVGTEIKTLKKPRGKRSYPNHIDKEKVNYERLRELKKESSFTFEELADRIDVKSNTIQHLVSGKMRMRKVYLQRLADVFGVEAKELLI